MKQILAFDFGASSGRAMLGSFDGGKLALRELHRFGNDPVMLLGTLYWDLPRLLFEIRHSIGLAARAGGFDAIGIDTWGVDFGLLDEYGELIGNPVHYRDKRTLGFDEEVFQTLPRQQLYAATGIQHMRINTVYQLAYLAKYRPCTITRAKRLLLMPDLLAYLLTGQERCELTNASTTNLWNPQTMDWAQDILSALGIPEKLFAPVIRPGEQYGLLREDICAECGCEAVPVYAVATHDTASAVVSVPTLDDDYIYISCGTWSLMGIETPEPLLTKDAQNANFTNEIGYGGNIRFLKNIMGLWLIQESRRQWLREGHSVSYAELEQDALRAAPFLCFIDPDAPDFETPGDMPARVRAFCARTGQHVPKTRGEVMRCIYQSLALKYRTTLTLLESITERTFSRIHMVGGGIKDTFLCRMTADCCGIPVHAGPAEATALGNMAAQLIGLGEIAGLGQAREIIRRSVEVKVYLPESREHWNRAYTQYQKVLRESPKE